MSWFGVLGCLIILCLPCGGVVSGSTCGGRRQGCRHRPCEITPRSQNLAAGEVDASPRSLSGGSYGLYNVLRGGQAGADGILDSASRDGVGYQHREGESLDPDRRGTGGQDGISRGDDNDNDNDNDKDSDGQADADSGQSTGDSHAAHAKLPDGASDWEKLKAYYASFEENVGKNEVDNIGIEEYGPHTVGEDAGKDWAGRGAFEWYTVPWEERPLIGELELPSGATIPLREGDLPNRNPFMPDLDEIAQKKPRAKKKPTSVASFEEQFAGQDLRNSDHWVAQLDSEAKQNMPPGGYPLSEDFLDGADDEEPPSTHSDSDFYEEVRNEAFRSHGRAALPIIRQLDKAVNYSGTEPPPDPNRRVLPGELTIRYDAEGRIDAIVPLELDELDCDPNDLSAEELNVKLWQYATDGRGNATKYILQAGAEVNAVSEYTHTALHYAARKGWTPVISTLLHHGADVNVTNQVGMTPLHYAAYYNHTAAVWMLLRAGADMNATSTFNYSAWDYAEDHEYREMQILFRAFSRNASDMWDFLYGDDFRESCHPGTFNSTPTEASGKYDEFEQSGEEGDVSS